MMKCNGGMKDVIDGWENVGLLTDVGSCVLNTRVAIPRDVESYVVLEAFTFFLLVFSLGAPIGHVEM